MNHPYQSRNPFIRLLCLILKHDFYGKVKTRPDRCRRCGLPDPSDG